jgi:hypothetical protein|tara:strand:- start:280 stop:426 length:147 start_codon:yes stop_codon:yes gene_type:complete
VALRAGRVESGEQALLLEALGLSAAPARAISAVDAREAISRLDRSIGI